ncbi:bifunctional riboflavin kinase/FAD synthetase [Pseudahrensia aquimaris]|uniref:Riboflavin biosynthesis protein n=1 Tax=Pseudahrensia aquimaris TaxID=744461 RepID=A0ABW3FFA2_9HYPH
MLFPSADFIHDLTTALPEARRGGVVAIGNFDGVHRGHQIVLERAMELARTKGVPCTALSFEPHPRTLFKPQSPVFRLTPQDMKARVLAALGLDGLLVLPFTRELAGTSADDFVDLHLLAAAGASHIVTGFNFHFGKDRAGSPEFLKAKGEKSGFGVTIVEAQADENADPISSSRIRRCLGSADVVQAAGLLGYRWCVRGEVIKGAQLGRTLGYPTANIALPENCRLAHGIYAVRLRRADGSLHNGVASYGRRPTFDNGEALLETFVFDFQDDLYGEEIEITLFGHLRGEEKFDSAEALVEQMNRDSAEARALLSAVSPLSALDQSIAFEGLVE